MVRATSSNVLRRITTLLIISCLLTVGLCVNTAAALPGSGTQEDPWRIESLADFDEFAADANYWDDYTRLETDVNLAGRTYTTAVIAPDTDQTTYWFQGTSFTGVFDANDHKISHLTTTGVDFLGLFGKLDAGAEVKDLGVVNVNIISSGFMVGGLVGVNCGTVTRCYSKGTVSNTGGWGGWSWVGGLVGANEGSIATSYSTAVVSGHSIVGGLAGSNDAFGSIIDSSYSTGTVSGTGDVGGLVGQSYEGITTSYSTGKVSGSWRVGGLVGGYDQGSIAASFWDMETSGQTTSAGGTGLTTAQMRTESTFICWAADGVWTIDDGKDYPRLWWENAPGQPITRDYYYGGGNGTQADPYLIYTAEHLSMIGLIKCDWDKQFKLMVDIDLSGYDGKDGRPAFNIIGTNDYNPFTGVFDGNDHKIINLTIDDSGAGNDYLGLFGFSGGEVRNLGLEDGSVSGRYNIGGLVAYNYIGSISNCYSTGDVNGVEHVGGLVGENQGSISNCYSTGDVSGGWWVGGMVGENQGSVSNCYSTGDVNGLDEVGGLVGHNGTIEWLPRQPPREFPGFIHNSYSTGNVQGEFNVGGLVGYNFCGDIDISFWDVETSGEPNMCGLQSEYATGCDPNCGKTTAEMQTKSTFTEAGWGFVEIWLINEGATYPVLRQEIRSDLNGNGGIDLLDFAIFADHWLEGTGD